MSNNTSAFDSALRAVSSELKKLLLSLNNDIKKSTYEIRLRADRPVMLYGKHKSLYFNRDCTVSKNKSDNTYICTSQELNDTFNRICGYSIHTYQQDINNGFVTLNGGHRVGICGTAVCNGQGEIVNIKAVTSLNIRIAREFKGCSDDIVNAIMTERDVSVIIVGAPSTGKTTILKDIAESLCDGRITEVKKVAVVDERGEISGGITGLNGDLLCSYPKDIAVMTALRTLSPEYIICDEIGNKRDIDAIVQGVNSGVNFVVTVHSADIEDFLQRPQTQALLETKSFNKIVFLDSAKEPCKIKGIYDAGELLCEVYRRRAGIFDDDIYRISDFGLLQKEEHSA